MREVTWDARSKWYDLGIELRVSNGTLKVSYILITAFGFNKINVVKTGIYTQAIKRDQDECDLCYTSLLEEWLNQPEPQPKWADLVTALRSPSIECGYIASQLEAMFKKS